MLRNTYFRLNRTAGLIAALVMAVPVAAAAEEFAVIVNFDNPIVEKKDAARDVIKQLFLKELSSWPDGEEAKPYAPPEGAPEEQCFYEQVLGMDKNAVEQHWLRLKQVKGETPPREVTSNQLLFRFVGKYRGGLGVVPASEAANAPNEVAVLFRFSE